MSLRVIAPLCALSLVTGCQPEIDIVNQPADLSVSPSLTDFSCIAAGTEAEMTIKVFVDGQYGSVKQVDLIHVEGEAFTVVPDQPLPVDVQRDGSVSLQVIYHPDEAGWHRAQLEINAHDGLDPQLLVTDIRGCAVDADVSISPLRLDFGPAAEGQVVHRSVTVHNHGDIDFVVDDAVLGMPVFAVSVGDLPRTVVEGTSQVIELTYTAPHTDPVAADLQLFTGGVLLPTVALIANNCQEGDPEMYDVDGDGFTSCGGDCNDGDPAINPAGTEVWDGVDQNCDGIADEGTAGYDDDGDGACEGPGICTFGDSDGDCNDGAIGVNPSTAEIPDNGIDDDCDGVVDLGTTDLDGDGYSPEGGDCDDNDANVHPGHTELADWLDNDCDGLLDETTALYDDDGDGFCEDVVCSDGSTPGDCDDSTADGDGDGVPDGRVTSPVAPEIADWRDNNCNSVVDEDTTNFDDDMDGYSEVGGDCDDTDPLVSPATTCP